MTGNEILEMLKERFAAMSGSGEVRIFFAPGRVNLIGEHTDYNGGHVFPCALSLGTYAAVRLREDRKIRMASLNIMDGKVTETSLDDLVYREEADWTNYPKGVIWAFEEEGMRLPSGMDILYYGNIPAGAGLSSSASLEVLTGLVLKTLFGFDDLDMVKVALLGQRAENGFVGMNCGIMDQFASAMGKEGHAIFLDTNTLTFEYAPMTLKNQHIVITNSNVKHTLASSAYNTRRAESEEGLKRLQEVKDIRTLGDLTNEAFAEIQNVIGDDVILRRARHAVSENIRTIEASVALKAGDIVRFGKLMNDSHVSMRDDYEISCEEIDFLVEKAWELDGVVGSRMTGGGFGGCTVSIVREDAIPSFEETLTAAYRQRFGKAAEYYVIDPGAGAHEIR
ncbi:MAG: galactokinase [Lachnospiraceae bacterium]|nr:galactokinase [Lachnospiraceae bacterium]